MFKKLNVLMNEFEEGADLGGESLGTPEGGEPDGSDPSYWFRDLTEDDAYDRFNQVKQFPQQLSALESRVFGSMGPVMARLKGLESSIPTRASLNTEKLAAVLKEYDPALAEKLVPAFQEAFQVAPLDENALRPHLEPIQEQLQSWVGEQIVLSNYSPKQIAEIVPDVVDGKFAPQNQRQKDFVDWYAIQDYETRQALQGFGANYVSALRDFEGWEKGKTQERSKTAGDKSSRLAGGQQPTSPGKRGRTAGPQTPEEAFLAGFNEIMKG